MATSADDERREAEERLFEEPEPPLRRKKESRGPRTAARVSRIRTPRA